TIVVIGALVAWKLASNVQTVNDKVYLPDENKKVLVKAQKVVKKDFDFLFSYTGTFLANREIMLVPQIPGEVKEVYFNEGEVVTQGKLLLQIDDAMLQSQHIAAKAAYDMALVNYERFKKASASEGISQMQIDNSLLQLKSAEAQLKQLEINIRKCKIVSPFNGTITYRDVEIGSVVGNNPVGRLTDISVLKLEVLVPESDIKYFQKNNDVVIQSDVFPNEPIKGKIEFVSDRGDKAHNYVVKIKVANNSNKLKAGMYASVTVNKQLHAMSLAIPRLALIGSAKNPQVYVVENNKVKLCNIVIGQSNGLETEVLSGIKEGELVVTSGLINLFDGCSVEIAQ
ncbi:MAG: efflux RND transporter periplasmic adaptor subunit, partial [Bacteroidales bacterium]|nr:efflux RND transporter periplasmic adaptor subunit [Bacteroidales bacterium]